MGALVHEVISVDSFRVLVEFMERKMDVVIKE